MNIPKHALKNRHYLSRTRIHITRGNRREVAHFVLTVLGFVLGPSHAVSVDIEDS